MLHVVDEVSMDDEILSDPLHEDGLLTVDGSTPLLGHPCSNAAMPLTRGLLGAIYALAEQQGMPLRYVLWPPVRLLDVYLDIIHVPIQECLLAIRLV